MKRPYCNTLLFSFVTKMEKLNRKKRIKTVRLRIERGEYTGVNLVCTRNRTDTIKFLIQKLKDVQKSFNPNCPPTATMKDLKLHIETQMTYKTDDKK